jgi:uncharacterized protein YndB with AHSA1/START domain
MALTHEKRAPELEPLVVSRIFPAARDLVFRAWSSAEHVKHWFCPEGYTVPEARIDFRVGGAFEVCMRSSDGEAHWMKGTIREIVHNARLVIDSTVGPDEQPLFRAQTVAVFEEQRGGSTRLEVTQHYTILDPSAVSMTRGASEGWRQTLDRLEREVVRMRQEPPAARSVVHGSFTIERTYPASRAQVFKALSEPEAKAKWFSGGAGYEVIERAMDVRPGGHERVSGRWASGVISTFDAVYHDVIPNERIVYSYVMHLNERKISASLATFEFKPAGAGTRLVLTEHGAFLDGYDDAGSRERGSVYLLEAIGKSLE